MTIRVTRSGSARPQGGGPAVITNPWVLSRDVR